MLKFLAGMLTMAALAAFVTKPSPEDAETELRRQMAATFAGQDLSGAKGLDAAALLACRVDTATCLDLLRAGLDVTYEDRILYARVTVTGFDRRVACYGLYTRFTCPGGLQPQ